MKIILKFATLFPNQIWFLSPELLGDDTSRYKIFIDYSSKMEQMFQVTNIETNETRTYASNFYGRSYIIYCTLRKSVSLER